MPDVRNCKRCGKIFNYLGGQPLCMECKEEDEKDFKRVKEYLYDNPGASMSEVSSALEISVQKIKGYLKEGRLEIINNDGNFFLECEACGKAIKSGRFCDSCLDAMSKDFQVTANQMKSNIVGKGNESRKNNFDRSIRMRYLKDK